MGKLNIISVNFDTAYDVVKENVFSCIAPSKTVEDTKFHHQINIEHLPSAIEHGILSKRNYVHRVENRELTDHEIYIFSDEDHVNGLDHVSMSTMDMDFSKIYRNEGIWGTYCTVCPTIVISKKVKTHMATQTYFNEFIVENEIPVDLFNSIDVRILRIMNHDSLSLMCPTKEDRIKYMLKYYEGLREVALKMKEKNLNIPLREVSEIYNLGEDEKANTLDVEKVIELPKLILK